MLLTRPTLVMDGVCGDFFIWCLLVCFLFGTFSRGGDGCYVFHFVYLFFFPFARLSSHPGLTVLPDPDSLSLVQKKQKKIGFTTVVLLSTNFHTYTLAHMIMTLMDTHIHVNTHADTDTHVHTHVYTYTQTYLCTRIHAHKCW